MKPDSNKRKTNKSYGNKLGFLIFYFIMRNIGVKWAYCLLLFIVPYYVIFRPDIYFQSKPYLERRFPNDSFIKRYLRLFKYIYIFGQTLIDQVYFGFVGESKYKLDFEREPEALELLYKKPVIFLMSHVGFWEVSMAGSVRFNKKLNVLVNKNFDKDKRKSFYDIQEQRFKLINVTENYGGMIEATNVLLQGELLGVTGDRAEQWRSKMVTFLGSPARFPVVAQQLALATGASLVALFSAKEKDSRIKLYWKDISTDVLQDEKLTKEEKIQKMLENYVDELEKYLQDYPYFWFNFFDFWQK